jgi:hypothetical protein
MAQLTSMMTGYPVCRPMDCKYCRNVGVLRVSCLKNQNPVQYNTFHTANTCTNPKSPSCGMLFTFLKPLCELAEDPGNLVCKHCNADTEGNEPLNCQIYKRKGECKFITKTFFICPEAETCTLAPNCAHAEPHEPIGFNDGTDVKCNEESKTICHKHPCVKIKGGE